jgi:hypothetical protein
MKHAVEDRGGEHGFINGERYRLKDKPKGGLVPNLPNQPRE